MSTVGKPKMINGPAAAAAQTVLPRHMNGRFPEPSHIEIRATWVELEWTELSECHARNKNIFPGRHSVWRCLSSAVRLSTKRNECLQKLKRCLLSKGHIHSPSISINTIPLTTAVALSSPKFVLF